MLEGVLKRNENKKGQSWGKSKENLPLAGGAQKRREFLPGDEGWGTVAQGMWTVQSKMVAENTLWQTGDLSRSRGAGQTPKH